MGKRKQSTKYEHNHTYNPRARESDDRKIQSLKSLEIKRLQSSVTKQKELMQAYIPPESRKKYKIDPLYDLKGAARVAREFYRPADYKEDVEPVNLIDDLKGKIWTHEEGRKLLSAMLELGVALHNSASRPRDAVKNFKEMLELDREDHLMSRQRLLRCYLDKGDALQARTLLERFSADKSSCFSYSRALIEHIALSLEEADASEAVRDEMMRKAVAANPYTIWAIAHHEVFTDCVRHLDQLQSLPAGAVKNGSLEDAFMFFDVDLPLWVETDGLIDYVRDFLVNNELAPPLVEVPENKPVAAKTSKADVAVATPLAVNSKGKDSSTTSTAEPTAPVLDASELHAMCVDMFVTAMEMIEEEQQELDEEDRRAAEAEANGETCQSKRDVDSVSGSDDNSGDDDEDDSAGSADSEEGERF